MPGVALVIGIIALSVILAAMGLPFLAQVIE
jgi:hypothetical protein